MTRKNRQTVATALKKYPTGISGCEENTGGGLPESRPAQVCARTSSGKTLFATVCIFLMLFYTVKAYSQLSAAAEGYDLTNHPLLFLGNETLPPMIYLKNDKPIGIVVDLAEALKERMTRPVRFKYMHWTQAQQLVLEGKADALLQINPTEERKKIYDFSDSLLESEFSIFISFGREGVYDITGLRGLKVGVEEKGLPINILKQDPLIKSVVIPDVIRGFHLLADGAVDAVVVDRWVGSFVLAENNIRGIRIAGEAIDKSNSAIAVRKGNTELLAEINKALAEIKEDGTYTEILAKWQSKEVIFQTKDQYFKQKIILAATLCVLIITIIWSIFLLNEIKKRKKTEEALRESEEKYQNLVKNSYDIVYSVTPDGIFTFIGPQIDRFGYETEDLISKNFIEFVVPEQRQEVVNSFEKGTRDGTSIRTEFQWLGKDGKRHWVEAVGKILYDDSENPLLQIGILRDIAERKQAEEQIKASLKEKEVLLREIHHRVKNNMQLIISLLRLQADKIEDKKYADMFKEGEDRIRSMSLIHEKLYQTQDFANINFGEHIKSLVDGLFVSHGVDTNRIRINMKIEDIPFDLENAIPCGLIINELVSNSLKYAFPQEKQGNILIGLRSIDEDEFELTISDDGIGISKDMDIEQTDTMGLHLVKVLAGHQLNGKIDLDRTSGTQFNIKFKRTAYKPRI